ncbi:MAG: hypothetical protein ACFCBW_10430, partial [Candidatus Competibacterales bacterium]
MARRRWAGVALGWLLAMACTLGVALTTPVVNDITLFVPALEDANPSASALAVDQLRRGPATRLLPMGLSHGTPAAPAPRRRAQGARQAGPAPPLGGRDRAPPADRP